MLNFIITFKIFFHFVFAFWCCLSFSNAAFAGESLPLKEKCLKYNPTYYCFMDFIGLPSVRPLNKLEYDKVLDGMINVSQAPIEPTIGTAVDKVTSVAIISQDFAGKGLLGHAFGGLRGGLASMILFSSGESEGEKTRFFALIPDADSKDIENIIRRDITFAIEKVFGFPADKWALLDAEYETRLMGTQTTQLWRQESDKCGEDYCYIKLFPSEKSFFKSFKQLTFSIDEKEYSYLFNKRADFLILGMEKFPTSHKSSGIVNLENRLEMLSHMPDYYYFYIPNTQKNIPVLIRGGGVVVR